MSLDVYLTIETPQLKPATIPIREGGRTHNVSFEEWQKRYPNRDPVVMPAHETSEVFSANITHNLSKMAGEAGIYRHLWRPREIGITKAKELIEPLGEGLERLRADPDRFREFNPENGWGDYEGLVRFVEGYLAACEMYPDAYVDVWR